MAEEVVADYQSSLSDLTFNSKPLINMLTMLAEENAQYAPQIVQVIEAHIQKAKPSEKLPALYLIDSIIKNVSESNYIPLFTPNICATFCSVFEKVDEKTRGAMFKLRQTWSDLFPNKKMYALDIKVKNQLDPAWPILATPPQSGVGSIHVNPKFLVKQETEEEERKKAQEEQEALMRQQLIAKQQELLTLKQQQLELELQETRNRLQEQTKQLVMKEQTKPPILAPTQHSVHPQAQVQPQPVAKPLSQVPVSVPGPPSRDPRLARDPRFTGRDPRQTTQPKPGLLPTPSLLPKTVPQATVQPNQTQPIVAPVSQPVAATAPSVLAAVPKEKAAAPAAPSMKVTIRNIPVPLGKPPAASPTSSGDKPVEQKSETVVSEQKKPDESKIQTEKKGKSPVKEEKTDTAVKAEKSDKAVTSKKDVTKTVKDKTDKKVPQNKEVKKSDSDEGKKDSKTDSRKDREKPKEKDRRSSKEKDKDEKRRPDNYRDRPNDRGHRNYRTRLSSSPSSDFDKGKGRIDRDRSRSRSPRSSRSPRGSSWERERDRMDTIPRRNSNESRDEKSHSKSGIRDEIKAKTYQDEPPKVRTRGDRAASTRGGRKAPTRTPPRPKRKTNEPEQASGEDKKKDKEKEMKESAGLKAKLKEEPKDSGPPPEKKARQEEPSEESSKEPPKESSTAPSQEPKAEDSDVKMSEADLSDLFGKEDQDYRRLPTIPKLQVPARDGPDLSSTSLKSPSHAGWTKFKATHPKDFPKSQSLDLDLRSPQDVDMRQLLMSPAVNDPLRRPSFSSPQPPDTPISPEQQLLQIPQELKLNSADKILQQAELQLKSGKITHDQHQELLKQLAELYRLQKLKQQLREEKEHNDQVLQAIGGKAGDTLSESPIAGAGSVRKGPVVLEHGHHTPIGGGSPRQNGDQPSMTPALGAGREEDRMPHDVDERVVPLLPGPHGPPRMPGPDIGPLAVGDRGPGPQFGAPRGPGHPKALRAQPDFRPTGPRGPGPRHPMFGARPPVPFHIEPNLPPDILYTSPDGHPLYFPQNDPRWVGGKGAGGQDSYELVIDNRPYELPLDCPRKIQLDRQTVLVAADSKSREVTLDGQCYYKLGDPIREFVWHYTHKIYYHGPMKRMWINKVQHDVYIDGPAERIDIGNKRCSVKIDGRTDDLVIDGKAVCKFGESDAPCMVQLGPFKHEVSFQPPARKILIDDKLCELKFNGPYPYVVIDGKKHGIRFDGPPHTIWIDNRPWSLCVDLPRRVKLGVGQRVHLLAFGGPGHEVIINGKWYEVKFGEPERVIKVGGRRFHVKLEGPPPEVKILPEIADKDMEAYDIYKGTPPRKPQSERRPEHFKDLDLRQIPGGPNSQAPWGPDHGPRPRRPPFDGHGRGPRHMGPVDQDARMGPMGVGSNDQDARMVQHGRRPTMQGLMGPSDQDHRMGPVDGALLGSQDQDHRVIPSGPPQMGPRGPHNKDPTKGKGGIPSLLDLPFKGPTEDLQQSLDVKLKTEPKEEHRNSPHQTDEHRNSPRPTDEPKRSPRPMDEHRNSPHPVDGHRDNAHPNPKSQGILGQQDSDLRRFPGQGPPPRHGPPDMHGPPNMRGPPDTHGSKQPLGPQGPRHGPPEHFQGVHDLPGPRPGFRGPNMEGPRMQGPSGGPQGPGPRMQGPSGGPQGPGSMSNNQPNFLGPAPPNINLSDPAQQLANIRMALGLQAAATSMIQNVGLPLNLIMGGAMQQIPNSSQGPGPQQFSNQNQQRPLYGNQNPFPSHDQHRLPFHEHNQNRPQFEDPNRPRPPFMDQNQSGPPFMAQNQQRPSFGDQNQPQLPFMDQSMQQPPFQDQQQEGLPLSHNPPCAPGYQGNQQHFTPQLSPHHQPSPPPPQQPQINTQIDVNDLFSKLLASGIIQQPVTKTEPGEATPGMEGKEEREETKEAQKEDVKKDTEEEKKKVEPIVVQPKKLETEEIIEDVPDLKDFKSEKLKMSHAGVVQRLYHGIQCSSCGVRFMAEETEKYREHLDWHFRQNKRQKDDMKVAKFRKWYFMLADWIQFEEIGDMEERAQSSFFESVAQAAQHNTYAAANIPMDWVSCPAATGNDNDDVCEICGEPFEQFWDEEEEEWHLKEAIRVDGKTYHPVCYEDAKESSYFENPQLQTPSPQLDMSNPMALAVSQPSEPSAQAQPSTEPTPKEDQIKQEPVDISPVNSELVEASSAAASSVAVAESKAVDAKSVEVKTEPGDEVSDTALAEQSNVTVKEEPMDTTETSKQSEMAPTESVKENKIEEKVNIMKEPANQAPKSVNKDAEDGAKTTSESEQR